MNSQAPPPFHVGQLVSLKGTSRPLVVEAVDAGGSTLIDGSVITRNPSVGVVYMNNNGDIRRDSLRPECLERVAEGAGGGVG